MTEFVVTACRGNDPPEATRVDLPDIMAARREAVRYAGELLIDETGGFDRSEQWTVTIADAAHLVLFTMSILWTVSPALGGREPPLFVE